MPPSDKTVLQCVMKLDEERVNLKKMAGELFQCDDDDDDLEQLMDVYDRLDELNTDTTEAHAATILNGLGFSNKMQQKATKEFSGDMSMRIALARALYMKPHLLLLDEPTNHLDVDTCVWLKDQLQQYKGIVVLT